MTDMGANVGSQVPLALVDGMLLSSCPCSSSRLGIQNRAQIYAQMNLCEHLSRDQKFCPFDTATVKIGFCEKTTHFSGSAEKNAFRGASEISHVEENEI